MGYIKHGKTFYNYHSAKKIYFICNSSKCFLIEKKPLIRAVSLLFRNPVITNKENGIQLFPESR